MVVILVSIRLVGVSAQASTVVWGPLFILRPLVVGRLFHVFYFCATFLSQWVNLCRALRLYARYLRNYYVVYDSVRFAMVAFSREVVCPSFCLVLPRVFYHLLRWGHRASTVNTFTIPIYRHRGQGFAKYLRRF